MARTSKSKNVAQSTGDGGKESPASGERKPRKQRTRKPLSEQSVMKQAAVYEAKVRKIVATSGKIKTRIAQLQGKLGGIGLEVADALQGCPPNVLSVLQVSGAIPSELDQYCQQRDARAPVETHLSERIEDEDTSEQEDNGTQESPFE